MIVEINGTEYEYLSNIVDNDVIRNNFIEFIYENFSFNFEKWYQAGFWTDKYDPHVLVKDNQVVSTVTVNHMNYRFNSNVKPYIQIGGVLTREGYRKKGLAEWLMKHIVEEYREKCDQIFLFSDDDAVEFYPKMGFEKTIEYIGSYEWGRQDCDTADEDLSGKNLFSIRKMSFVDPVDRLILLDCYRKSNPFSVFPSVDCEELVVFYGLEFKKDCFYYFPEYDLVAVAKVKSDEIFLYDIYGELDFNRKPGLLTIKVIIAY